jgi:signal transduction histidine kinase
VTGALVVAALYFLPVVVWGVVAGNGWRFLLARRPSGTLMLLLPLLASVMTAFYAMALLFALVPAAVGDRQPCPLVTLYRVSDALAFVALALFGHGVRLMPAEEDPPGRRWLAMNYGLCTLACVLALGGEGVLPLSAADQRLLAERVLLSLYALGALGAAGVRLARRSRPGFWHAGAGALAALHADVVLLAGGFAVLAALVAVQTAGGWETHRTLVVVLSVTLGLLLAVPLAMRMLGEVLRGILLATSMVVVTAVLYFGSERLVAPHLAPELHPMLDVMTVLAIVVALGPVHAWRRAWIDRVVFRRRRRRLAELQAFLHTLSPELGGVECCRRALAEVARDPRLRGAAVLLRDGTTLVEGTLAVAPLESAWPRGVELDALSPSSHGWSKFMSFPPPLREALTSAQISGVTPIASPRRLWGHLFLATRAMAVYGEEDLDAFEAFAAQLALLLDAADLLVRTVAAERSLAHAEKLAAIGETAARIAHEIRNPVTAARSLAQQLARDPLSSLNTEHARLILDELERVERQVAALLHFARREELRLESTDLAELVRGTVEALRPRLESAGVAVSLDMTEGVVARIDREKVRQVLVNLIDNALDALVDAPGARRLEVSLAGTNGTARLAVSDTGPGVAADVLPRLFEPFFSRKAQGTGLGLAIARRTVEAHGGRIEASVPAGGGMAFRLEVPLGGERR